MARGRNRARCRPALHGLLAFSPSDCVRAAPAPDQPINRRRWAGLTGGTPQVVRNAVLGFLLLWVIGVAASAAGAGSGGRA